MEEMISQAEAQDLLNAVASQRDASHNREAQLQATLSKMRRESAKQVADLEAKVAVLEEKLNAKPESVA